MALCSFPQRKQQFMGQVQNHKLQLSLPFTALTCRQGKDFLCKQDCQTGSSYPSVCHFPLWCLRNMEKRASASYLHPVIFSNVIFSTSSALQLPYTEPLLVFICNSYSFPATSSLGRCIQSQGCVYSFLTRTHFWISSGYFSWHHLLLLEGFPMEMFSNLLCLLVIEQFYVPYLAKLCVSFYENSSCTIKMSFLQRKERVE